MWLINSSVGRKVVMSLTGIALILFLTFHCAMNIIALFSGEAYNTICELLGANWYAVVATLGLAALAVAHIVFAFILTAQNRKARGTERYAVTDKPAKVEWASQNMLVLGIIILLGLLLHLFNFWYNMMFAELFHIATAIPPTDGFELIKVTFANPVYVVLYVIWIVAIWFHLTHGFWSAMQTLGVSGKIWFCRWRVIGFIYTTLLMLGFLVVVLAFAFKCAPSLCCEKAALCCDMPAVECCEAGHKCDAHKCDAPKCDAPNAECCLPVGDCCKPGAECCKLGAECCEKPECCKPGAECCK